jgi:hypothetical protein
MDGARCAERERMMLVRETHKTEAEAKRAQLVAVMKPNTHAVTLVVNKVQGRLEYEIRYRMDVHDPATGAVIG